MGEKDIVEKSLEDYDDVFADIINGLLFGGEMVIRNDELEELHPVSEYRSDNATSHAQERDVVKRWKKNLINVAVIGVENQSSIDQQMPIRVISYDAGAYRRQLADHEARMRLWRKEEKQFNKPENQEQLEMQETRKKLTKPVFCPIPVTTLILYFGKEHWQKKTRLKEIIEIPERLEPYVSDYKINVFEISWLSDEQISYFKSDFGIVANFFAKKRRDPEYIPDDLTGMIHPDEVLKLIAAVVGDMRYLKVNDLNKESKVKNMCEVADRLVNMGKAEGREEGKKEGLKEGIKRGELKTLIELVKDGILTLSDAARRAEMTEAAFKTAVGIK